MKHSYEYIKEQIENEGYILISKEYIVNNYKLKFKCDKGHIFEMRLASFSQDQRCSICYGTPKHSYEFIKEQIEKEGYKLLSKEYKNNKQKLSVECDKGHQWKIKWNSFQRGTRCIVCSYIDRGNNQRGKNNPMFGYIYSKKQLKKRSEIMKGNKNPAWKGGISFEPYCQVWKDKDYRKDIKEYYNYQCQNPFCLCDSNNLVLHHIDYDKKNCKPDNIIPVCRSSNAKANMDRWFWQEIYEEIVRIKQEKCVTKYVEKERKFKEEKKINNKNI